MTDPRAPSNPNLPESEQTQRRRHEMGDLLELLRTLISDVQRGNNLAAASAAVADLNAKRLTKQVIGQAVAAGAFVVVAIGLFLHGCHMAERLGEVTAKLDESTRLLDSLRAEQDKTQKKVDGVGQQVQAVADDQPQVVLVDGGAGKPAKPSIVVKPSKPKAPAAPVVTVPLDLPKATITDGGAP